jgi:hypothetical protein
MVPLLIVSVAALTAVIVVYLIRRTTATGTRVFSQIAERLGIGVTAQRNHVGVEMSPFAEGTYRGRPVRIRNAASRQELSGPAAHLQQRLTVIVSDPSRTHAAREVLVPRHLKAFAYVEVGCVNPADLVVDVRAGAPTRGSDGAADFARSFSAYVSAGQEAAADSVLTEGIREELGRTVTSRFLHPFHALLLAGNSLIYVENNWFKDTSVERLVRMTDLLCDAAERVDRLPAGSTTNMAATAPG